VKKTNRRTGVHNVCSEGQRFGLGQSRLGKGKKKEKSKRGDNWGVFPSGEGGGRVEIIDAKISRGERNRSARASGDGRETD